MGTRRNFAPSSHLKNVTYEIRGPIDKRAQELEKQGKEIIKLNIGNPALFGFRAPETMIQAVMENLSQCSGYSVSRGIFPAREAIVMEAQSKGIINVHVDDVFLGNGVSELIMMAMEALLEEGDEVLLPAPDYPLWSAAVVINKAKPVYYSCVDTEPNITELEKLLTDKTRAIVLVNPNNPTGAVYTEQTIKKSAAFAEKNQLIVFSDEIYDRILYGGTIHTPIAKFCRQTLCVTLNGLSKVYRAAGFRVGWAVFSGDKSQAIPYMQAMELLCSMRLCSNVPGQWAVQTALGGRQSIYELTADSGRLGKQRNTLNQLISQSQFLSHVEPKGAMYGFIKVNKIPNFNDRKFAMQLLEEKNVLVVPGSSFHVDDPSYFRVTFLPDSETLTDVFGRIESLLSSLKT
jgi:alanine-synthesizing transaminase